MKINDAMSLEDRDNNEDLFKIYLISEGEWYRIYEWSAYLINNIPSKRNKENNSLKLTKKVYKNAKEGLIYSGIKPLYFPNYLPENFETKSSEFNGIEILTVDVSEYFKDSNITIETYKSLLEEYKKSIELSVTKNENEKNVVITHNAINRNLIDTIMSFCIIDKTPLECCKFIQELQRNILKGFV